MYSYIQRTLQILVWFSLGVAGLTNLQGELPLISGTRVGNGVVSPTSELTLHDRELVPIEPIHNLELNNHIYY